MNFLRNSQHIHSEYIKLNFSTHDFLRSYQGTQRYPIPDVIKLDNYKSVVIWCRMANATFGYAPIGNP